MDQGRERIAADPALVAALTAAYDGTGDPLDQLWWLEHPGEPTPDGVPDPSASLRELRERAYRPGAEPGAAQEAAALDAVLRRDRAAAAEAAERVLARADPFEAPAPEAREPEDAQPQPQPQPQRVAVRTAVLLGAAAAAVTAIGGALIGSALAPAATSSRPAPTASALAVFARAPRSTDLPPADVLPDFVQGAELRRLQTYSSIGTTAYGARTTDGRICLLTVVDALRSQAACVSAAGFADGGVSTVIIADADPVDLSGRRPQDEIDLAWLPNGFIEITPVPVPTASPSAS